MKRNEFLKASMLLAGSAYLYSCENDLINDIAPSGSNVDIQKLKEWFEDYVKKINPQILSANGIPNARMSRGSLKRKIDWNSAKKVKNSSGSKEYVIAKVLHDDLLPSILL